MDGIGAVIRKGKEIDCVPGVAHPRRGEQGARKDIPYTGQRGIEAAGRVVPGSLIQFQSLH